MENTQLRSATGYNVDDIIFSKVQVQKIGDTGMTSKRINISTKNEDGTEGELVFETTKLFSFGVSENVDQKTKEVNGYTFPLCLHAKDGASDDELAFTETFEKIVERCKDYLIENKKELKLKDLERSDLRKLNPIYYKKNEDGEIAEGSSPTLYAKLIVSKKNGQNKIITEFFDGISGNPIKPLDLIGKYCYTKAVIKIESIFLGSKISLQVKLYEAEVNLINSGVKKLLRRPAVNHIVKVISSNVTNPLNDEDEPPVTKDSVDDDAGSLKNDDDDVKSDDDIKDSEPEPVKEAPKKKKIVRKAKA
jgi:hypothetical protein